MSGLLLLVTGRALLIFVLANAAVLICSQAQFFNVSKYTLYHVLHSFVFEICRFNLV